MKRLSIRWKLTLWYGATLGGLLLGFCLILLILMRQQLLSRTDAVLREELQEVVREMELVRNEAEFQQHLHARFFEHDIYDFVITDAKGNGRFVSSGLTEEQAAALKPNGVTSESTQYENQQVLNAAAYRTAVRRMESLFGPVIVQSLTPLRPLQEEMRSLLLLMGLLLPLGLSGAPAGGYFLAARALAPVGEIVKVAEAITISDLHRRIEVANSHDEIGHLALTLNGLIARLEQAVTEIQRFTADASHELRTPLAVLRSEAEVALRRRRSPEEYERTLSNIVEEVSRLGRLADQLLNLSRHDAGILPHSRETVRVDAVLADVIEQLRPLAQEQNVSIHADLIAPCETRGDDVRLSQALFNVVENAIKFSSVRGKIEVRCECHAGTAAVTVRDEGIGIPAEHLHRVFDRFYRVDPSRHSQTGGAGLGLAIARAAIQVHDGEIHLQSTPSLGTTVTIRLPASAVPLDANPSESDLELHPTTTASPS